MKFHLDYQPEKSPFTILHSQKIMMLGSCFAENIGGILSEHKFNIKINPGGIIFNPKSLYQNLKDSLAGKPTDQKFFSQRGEECFSFFHHSSVKEKSVSALQQKLENLSSSNNKYLREADYLIITFGSAHYYYHKELDTCVANCHKQPGRLFEKKLLSIEEIVKDYSNLLESLQKENPKLKIIFTVSPVKYLRDGVVENNISKSVLILAVHELCRKYREKCFYFPAYELMNDDLRDYRFYKEDLAHPNEQAIRYIWEKFSETCFDQQTIKLNGLINKLNLAENHRTLHPNEEEGKKLESHISHLKEQIRKLMPD